VYYSYDFGNPANHERPSFFYNFNRHNEANLDLGFINASYTSKNVRANFGLMAGTYAQYNLSAEQSMLRNLWQANVGVKLSGKKNFWLDAGVFPSHIGFESAVGKSCDALTRCIIGDNTPFYESGIKIGYTSDNSKWFLSGLVINGWQRIARVHGNNTPASEHKLRLLQTGKLPLTIAHLLEMINRIVFLKCATTIISMHYLMQRINSGSPWVLIMAWNKKVKAAVSIINCTVL